MRVVKNGINADQVITVAVTTLLVEKKRKEKKRKEKMQKKHLSILKRKNLKFKAHIVQLMDGWMDDLLIYRNKKRE
jgi:hypothetical protein